MTSGDYVAITNYATSPKTAAELYNMALQYLDTAKATWEINEVTFLAMNVTRPLSDPSFAATDKDRKYRLITFGFNHDSEKTKNDPKRLSFISLWNEGQVREYDCRDEKMLFDSILKSPTPLKN